MVASTRLLDFLLDFDGDAIVHKQIIMEDLDGNIYDDDHHFVDVVRSIQAIDYANSEVRYRGAFTASNGMMIPDTAVSVKNARMLDNIDPEHHIFRQKFDDGVSKGVIISDKLKKALKSEKPAFRNLRTENLFFARI